MELEHSFTIPVPPEQAWEVLLDVEQVAPCMPGATIDAVDGDVISGRIKVKVGPIALTYAGQARFTEKDEQARVVVLEASGKETRGTGTASATVRSTLQDLGGQTRVTVHTTMNITGRPAQFGRHDWAAAAMPCRRSIFSPKTGPKRSSPSSISLNHLRALMKRRW